MRDLNATALRTLGDQWTVVLRSSNEIVTTQAQKQGREHSPRGRERAFRLSRLEQLASSSENGLAFGERGHGLILKRKCRRKKKTASLARHGLSPVLFFS